MTESLTVKVKATTRAECLAIARQVAVDAFTVDGDVQPFTETGVRLTQSAQGGLEDERWWAGEVSYVSTPLTVFGVTVDQTGEPERVNLPGIDVDGLSVAGTAVKDILDVKPTLPDVKDPGIGIGKLP